MAEPGFLQLSRKLFSHQFWCEKRVFSRAEAWLDLIREAAWKPHKKLISGHLIEVQRGGIVASVRFLADRWKWSTTKVCLFLDVLRLDEMIKTEKRHGITLVLLCNFEQYNTPGAPEKIQVKDSGKTAGRQREDETEEGKEGERKEAEGARLHETYCARTGLSAKLDDRRKRAWTAFAAKGFTEEDMKRVIHYIEKGMNDGGKFDERSLQFSVLIEDLSKFEERLLLAKREPLVPAVKRLKSPADAYVLADGTRPYAPNGSV